MYKNKPESYSEIQSLQNFNSGKSHPLSYSTLREQGNSRANEEEFDPQQMRHHHSIGYFKVVPMEMELPVDERRNSPVNAINENNYRRF
jgi:hypothetical protein